MSDLVNYGIFEDRSELRIHVGTIAHVLYVYPTKKMQELLHDHADSFRKCAATQQGANDITAEGYCVPIEYVRGLREIAVDAKYFDHYEFSPDLSEAEKGDRTERLVSDIIRDGYIPMSCVTAVSRNIKLQREGCDLIVKTPDVIVQIKHDRRAGPKTVKGCSGNLFVQTKERNPFQQR